VAKPYHNQLDRTCACFLVFRCCLQNLPLTSLSQKQSTLTQRERTWSCQCSYTGPAASNCSLQASRHSYSHWLLHPLSHKLLSHKLLTQNFWLRVADSELRSCWLKECWVRNYWLT
jgi:hypothetical protein